MRLPVVVTALVPALLVASCSGCRRSGTDAEGVRADAAGRPSPAVSASGAVEASVDDEPSEPDGDASDPSRAASVRFRDAGPQVDRDLEGPVDPACTGAEVSFADAVVDARCAISSARARKLRALLERDSGLGLRQEAKLARDGRVTLRLVNGSGTSLALPLSFHGKLPAFSVLAEDERHTLYELESPELELRDRGEGSRSHFARIVLAPAGIAVATVNVVPGIRRVLGRGAADPCRNDAGSCNPAKLGKGHYVLHVGELLTDVEAGPPARVEIDLP